MKTINILAGIVLISLMTITGSIWTVFNIINNNFDWISIILLGGGLLGNIVLFFIAYIMNKKL